MHTFQMMRPFFTITLLLILISSCSKPESTATLSGDTWDEVIATSSGKLTALYVPAEGFSYHDKEGNLTGVTIDILNEFANYLSKHYQIELEINYVQEANWSRFYNMVVEGEDGLVGMGNVTITDERRSELAFTPYYMTNIASLITHENAPELVSIDDLNGTFTDLIALAFEGTLHEERLKKLVDKNAPGIPLQYAQSNTEIIEKISQTNTYFAYIDIYNYWRAVEQGLPLRRHEVADEADERFGYIMPLKTSWHPILNEFFEADGGFLQSDRYREIMEAHLGEDLADQLIP
jgi:ABC-type amino acid transport substrate-binding protein